MLSHAHRLLIALVLAGSAVVLTQLPAHACKCAAGSTKDDIKRADAVFSGVLLDSSTGRTGERDRRETTYEIEAETVYRGTVKTADIVVTTETDSSCGLGELEADKRYLFFVVEDGAKLTTDQCSGTARASGELVEKVEKALGAGTPLTPTREPVEKVVFTRVADAEPDSLARLAAPGAALVLAGFLGLLLVRRLAARG